MKSLSKHIIFVFATILLTSNCARKGRPNGGLKDSLAPVMVIANPPYKSVDFKSKKIKFLFDEYITLQKLNEQLIISPPLKNTPEISPQGYPSKEITIKISDTLKNNTTYIFNFGNSIKDNNEGNVLNGFNYIFSTGKYVDSLKVTGLVKDAFQQKVNKDVRVLLYKIDGAFTDSIIYKKKPNYIANTIDSLYQITNIKAGKYLIIALKDVSNNNLFNPKEDKIGFHNRFIEVPKDSVLNSPLSLFKEVPRFRIISAKEISKGKIMFGFEGDNSNIKIEILSDTPSTFKSESVLDSQKDSVYFWHSAIQKDSLIFKIKKDNYETQKTVFLRSNIVDSLKVNSNITSVLDLKDTLTLTTNNPINSIDTSKILFLDTDSLDVNYQVELKKATNKIHFLFDKKELSSYKLTILPKALTDIFKTQNDTLKYRFRTKEREDYGSISFELKKAPSVNVFIELISENDDTVLQKINVSQLKSVKFEMLPPGKYIVRAIIDSNNNNKWDGGNYLKKKQPETVIYHPTIFNIRANWALPSEIFEIN